MPRPGPRPYECVRRAWHSDRHQPIRGSIIQQIFRVVHESHSAATRKNREWQEKLPIVVLRAEEIMYSKANSEAEYMDLDTLWDRVNDAVNTIIRRDESSETGQLLPPCIEAALNLGCIPVRASRSQRHTNPRCYLSPRVQEPATSPPQVLDKTHEEQRPPLSSLHSGNQLTFSRQPCSTMKPSFPVSETRCHVTETNNATAPRGYPFLYEKIPPGSNQSATKETRMQVRVASVYPLYYGNQYQTDKPQMFPQVSENTNLDNIIVGKPISEPVAEPAEMVVLQNFFSCPGDETASARTTHTVYGNSNGKQSGLQCDLSLRLGLFSDPCMPVERSLVQETEVLGSSSSHNRGEFSHFSSPKNKEVCFFPGRSIGNPLGSCSIKWFQEGEDQNLESSMRKRKTPFHDNVEDSQFCLQPAFPSNQFIGQMDRPGL